MRPDASAAPSAPGGSAHETHSGISAGAAHAQSPTEGGGAYDPSQSAATRLSGGTSHHSQHTPRHGAGTTQGHTSVQQQQQQTQQQQQQQQKDAKGSSSDSGSNGSGDHPPCQPGTRAGNSLNPFAAPDQQHLRPERPRQLHKPGQLSQPDTHQRPQVPDSMQHAGSGSSTDVAPRRQIEQTAFRLQSLFGVAAPASEASKAGS